MKNALDTSQVLGNLNKATFIELFYDLMFIVCMRSITPLLSPAEGSIAGWYECYTFIFCFIFMVQVWFSSTVLVNRCGTGGPKDMSFLLVNMALLLLMTRAMSTSWEHYFAFNVFWMLINANTILHWFLRYREMSPEQAKTNRNFIVRVVITHALAMVLVFASLFFSNVPAQIICLVALLIGFISWPNLSPLSEAGQEHLAERCALFLILAFGETFVGLSSTVSEAAESQGLGFALILAAIYFLIIVGMFLVYLVHFEKKLDYKKLGSGSRYMAVNMLLLFCAMSITATFELELEGKSLFFMDIGDYFSLVASVYLLSFMLFRPFVKPPVRKSTKIRILRACICVLPFAATLVMTPFYYALESQHLDSISVLISAFAILFSIVVFMLSSFLVFLIDYKMYTPKKQG